MRTNWILSTAVVAVSLTAAVGAQSTAAMGKPSQGDAMRMTYTGCVESVNHGAAFLLTGVERGGAESMHGDVAMKHREDVTVKDTKPSTSFALAGSANLSKHVGQKVSVTGSLSDGSTGTMRPDVSTVTVKTLKVIAKSCS